MQNFSLNWQFYFFGPNLPKKLILVKEGKIEHRHWILHIRISLDTKLKLKLQVLIFYTKNVQRGYFQSKTENVDITLDLHIRISRQSVRKTTETFSKNVLNKHLTYWKIPKSSPYPSFNVASSLKNLCYNILACN